MTHNPAVLRDLYFQYAKTIILGEPDLKQYKVFEDYCLEHGLNAQEQLDYFVGLTRKNMVPEVYMIYIGGSGPDRGEHYEEIAGIFFTLEDAEDLVEKDLKKNFSRYVVYGLPSDFSGEIPWLKQSHDVMSQGYIRHWYVEYTTFEVSDIYISIR